MGLTVACRAGFPKKKKKVKVKVLKPPKAEWTVLMSVPVCGGLQERVGEGHQEEISMRKRERFGVDRRVKQALGQETNER